MIRLRYQLLPCSVEVAVEDERVADALRYAGNGACQPVEPFKTLRYEVRGRGPYAIHEEDDFLERVATPDEALYLVYRRSHQRAYDLLSIGGWILLHAGIVRVAGRRLLVSGAKGAGKTTLAASLLFAGHRVEGDELALARAGEVVAFPRALHLKPGVENAVPELGPLLDRLPASEAADGRRFLSFDPGANGFHWELATGPIDAIVRLEPNHGAPSAMTPIAPPRTMALLAAEVLRVRETTGRLVGELGRLVRSPGFELRFGDIRQAIELLGSIPA